MLPADVHYAVACDAPRRSRTHDACMPDIREPARPAWRHGVAFCDDKLYHFDPRSAVVMRLWPEMRAWRRTPCRPWQHTRRWADEVLCRVALRPGAIEDAARRRATLVGPLSPDQYLDSRFRDSVAWAQGIATIPPRARLIAARFKDRRWHVLAMMARCPRADDLLEANPALGFALASHWVLHRPVVRQPMRAMRTLVDKPQARILEWLGFPATERVRRILKKIDPAALTGRLLPQLCRGLADGRVIALLAHLPRINEEVLRWVLWDVARAHATPAFLHELATFAPLDADAALMAPSTEAAVLQPRLDDPAPHLRLWREARAVSEAAGAANAAVITSVRHLRRWHREALAAGPTHVDDLPGDRT